MEQRDSKKNIDERLSYNKHNLRKARKHKAFTGYAYFFIYTNSDARRYKWILEN